MKSKQQKTIEEVVRVEYIAEDGLVFYNEEECKKYEASALFAISKSLKRLSGKWASICDLMDDGSDECELEIFDIQTEGDLENLRRYLYLKAMENGASEKSIKECFTSADGVTRKDYVFDNVTIGHEVLIFWGYDQDWFWTYKDGSLEGYLSWIKDKYTKIVTPKEN